MNATLAAALEQADDALERHDRDSFLVALVSVLDHEQVREPLHKLVHALACGHDAVVTDSNESLSPAQVAVRLGVSRKLVNKMIDAGAIRWRTKPHSTHRVVPAAEVIRLLEERRLFETLGRIQHEGARVAAQHGIDRKRLDELIHEAGEPSPALKSHVDALVDAFDSPIAHGHLRRGDVDAFLAATAAPTA